MSIASDQEKQKVKGGGKGLSRHVVGRGKTKTEMRGTISQTQEPLPECAKNVPQIRRDHSLRCTSGFSALNNTIVLTRSTALAYILARRKVTFHLMSP
jgi:hypothetical protein